MDKYNLNLLFLGGDKRQEHIYKIISEKFENSNLTATDKNGLDLSKLKNADILILPTIASTDNITLNAPLTEQKIIMQNIFKDAISAKVVIAGKISQDLSEECELNGMICKQYIESDAFKILNAIPTAEGAVSLAINNTEKTLWGAKCLVIGNGCIGKALSNLLKAFGAAVTVSARKEKDFAEIESRGMLCTETRNINLKLYDYDIIFNTVPYRVIDNEVLESLSNEILIIDLASKPYGLDHSIVSECNCKVILGSSLPGIYSPVTAARIASSAIEGIINEVVKSE